MSIHKEQHLGNVKDVTLWKKMMQFAKPYRLRFAASLGLAVLIVAASLAQPYLIKVAIDDHFAGKNPDGFFVIGALFLLTVIAASALTFMQTILLQNTGQKVIYDIRQSMFRRLTSLQTAYYDRNPVGRLVTRVAHDVEALNQLYSQVIVNLIKEICMLIGIVFIMFQLHMQLSLIVFSIIPVLVVMTFYFKNRIRNAQRYTRLVLSRLNSFLAENLSGIRIVQMFTREKKQIGKFDELNEEHYRAGMRATVLNSIFNPAVGFLGIFALALIVWYGGKSVFAGTVSFGVVYAFTHYVRDFFQPIQSMADRFTQIQMAMASAERIFEVLDEREMVEKHAPTMKTGSVRVRESKLRGEIEFSNVWFAYNKDEWVLRNISFRAEPGETVAFVGATGAGKTSIIQLINRFYEIDRGDIRIDGVSVKEMDLAGLRRSVGIIPQDSFVFSGTVRDNIRLNREDITDEEIECAAQILGVDAFIRRLPEQYDTLLGEQGLKLSSGQQQLLAFLRAYVYDPDILILDEATAHIDTETELLVQEGLKRISAGRTTLIVAHRLSTIRHADKIIVLQQGEIREIGTHEQLLRKGGIYRRLHDLQNKDSGGIAARAR